MNPLTPKTSRLLTVLTGLVALVVLAVWWKSGLGDSPELRVPGTDAATGGETGGTNPVLTGKLIPGSAQPSELPGDWPQFRGANRDGLASEIGAISRDWKTSPPRELWGLDVGESYAGVSVRSGRVYLLDYDRDAKQSALRCLSLAEPPVAPAK